MKRNKKIVSMILMTALLSGVCGGMTGCGGTTGNAGRERAASEGAVSGQPVSDNPAEEKEKTSEYTYCTDTNLYRFIGNETGEYVLQSRLDGTHKKKLKIPRFSYLDYVSEDWLYYEVLMKEEDKNEIPMTAVCRAPIRKDEEGYDVVELEKAEEVVSGINTKAHTYVDDEYVLYTKADEGTFVKYDIRTQTECADEDFEIEDAEPGSCIRVGDMFVMADYNNTRMYAQRVEETSWRYIEHSAVANPECHDHMAWSEQALYYTGQGEELADPELEGGEYVFRYDAAQQKDETFVSREELNQIAEQALGLTEEDKVLFCFVYGLFYWKDRVYIQVQIDWDKNGDKDYMRYMMMSKGAEESELRYEKRLTETMWQHGDERVKETANANDAQCIAMWDGKAYFFLYDYEKKKAGLGCLELENWEFRQIDKDDAWFYTLYQDEQILYNHYGDIETVFEDDYLENEYIGLAYSARQGIWFD